MSLTMEICNCDNCTDSLDEPGRVGLCDECLRQEELEAANAPRVERGDALMALYEKLPGVESRADGASFEQVLADMLTDLRHATHAHDIECFSAAVNMSLCHWEAETETSEEDC